MTYTPIPAGTLNWDVSVNAAFTDQDGRITTNTNSIATLSSSITTNLDNLVFNVRNHGAVGDGVTDDAPAINALIDSLEASTVHGTIYFPRGTYLINSPLTPTSALRYTGDQGAVIKSSNNDIFNFAGNYMHPGFNGQVGVLEIDHLTLDATGGHVFNNAVINQGSFHDLNLIQRSAGKSIWLSSGTLLVINFENIISTVYGATRSVPAWSITGISTADVANLTWTNCLFQNNDNDNTQYMVLLQATDGTANRRYHEQCAFINCYFEKPFGGAVKCLSGEGTLFQNCRSYDIFTGATVGASTFYLGSGANSTWPTTNTTFIGCGRDLQGPNGSTTWDIQMEPATVQTTIQNYSVRDIPTVFDGHPFFNLGNSTSVTLINNAEQTLTNANGTGFWNITADGSASGSGASMDYSPSDINYKAWSFDPIQVSGTGIIPGAGVVNLTKVLVRQPISVSNITMYLNVAGSGLTSGQNFAGIYNSAGTLVATTADQTTAWGTLGLKTMALTGAPFTLNPGFYWVAFFSNGTTRPTFGKNNNSLDATLYNNNLTAANLRSATNGTATTALAGTITPASNVALNVPWWVALS